MITVANIILNGTVTEFCCIAGALEQIWRIMKPMGFSYDSLKFENKSNPQSSEPRPSLHSLHLDASRLVANELAVFTQTIVSKGDPQMINGLKNICDEVEIYHNILR